MTGTAAEKPYFGPLRRSASRSFTFVIPSLLFGVATAVLDASAQSYPARSIRLLVPASAGGNLTIVSRAVGQKLSEAFGHQIIVDNRPGGNGVIAADILTNSAADGYTVMIVANTFMSTPGLIKGVVYDPVKDFSGVSMVATLPQALVVHPSLPVHSVKELIALAKAHPGELAHAIQGETATGRIAVELFTEKTGARFLNVPYKGGAPAMIDLIGGQVSLLFATVSTALPQVKAGRARILAVTSLKRSPAFPDVPTIDEAGVPGFEMIIFNLIVAPAGTPLDVRKRLQSEIAKVVTNPALHRRFIAQGVELTASASPDECSAFVKSEYLRYNQLWRRLGLLKN
jgi:tripartite-type tricarboxylate transporter receptor subunit TctC